MARQRNFNGNPSPIVIPNRRGEQPDTPATPAQPEQRRPLGFGADMDTGRMTQYFNDGSQETHYNTPAEQMFDQIGQVIQRGQAARQQKRQMDDAALASALVYSKQNNGFMPPDMTEAISQQLGIPVAGGNFARNGDYIIYGRKQIQSQNGKVRGEQIVPIAIANPEMQFKVLQRSGLGQSMQEELYDAMRAKSKLTEQQLSDRGIIDPRAKQKAAEAQMALKEKELMLKYGRKPLSFGEFIKAVTSSDQLMNSITGMDASGNIAQKASDDPGASNVKADPATLVAQRLRKAYDEWSRPDAANDPWAAMAQSQGQTQQPQNPQSPQNPQPQAQQPGGDAQGQEDELLPNGQMRHNGKLYEKAGERNGVVQWRPVGNVPQAQGQSAPGTGATRHPASSATPAPADDERRERTRRKRREETLRRAGVSEEVAAHYDGVDSETMRRFKDAYADEGIDDADIYSGKYDQELRSLAERLGDNGAIAALDRAGEIRKGETSRKRGEAVDKMNAERKAEYDEGMEEIRRNAEREGTRKRWTQREIDEKIKRDELMLKERLRKKYNSIQAAMA